MHLSVWEKESYYAPADVLIAGSGFVGLWCAYYLKKKNPRIRITIVDRGAIPIGASTRNAGFACFGSPTELLSDRDSIGQDKMLHLAEMRFEGISVIQKNFHKKEIDFDNCGGYELIKALTPDRYNALNDDVEWLNSKLSSFTHKKRTYRFADDKIKSFGFRKISHLLYTKAEGSLHPGKLSLVLSRKLQSMGVTILPGIEILRFENVSGGLRFYTGNEVELAAAKLIVCTNAFAKQLLPDLQITPARGQVLVTAPIPSLKIKSTFHFDEGYYYFRNIGNRLLIGGARNAHLEQETTVHLDIAENVQQSLEQFVRDHILPKTPFEVTDRWSGIMGMGPEKMPIVKAVTENVFAAVRMGGMGVALAPVVGRQVASMVLDS